MEQIGPASQIDLNLLSRNAAVQDLYRKIERAALVANAVLITGETGTGKEFVARTLHERSIRCNGPMIEVNCGAIAEHLAESELFGHEKGAFTGADQQKTGLFESADKGTIFLDEIGELDGRLQVKLLRVLDGAPFYRVGGTKKVAVNARVIAATNRDLDRAVNEGRFRNDLRQRLGQIILHVPPLRERIEDIPAFASHLLRQSFPEFSLSNAALDLLKAYSWPGNLRELRNVLIGTAISVEAKQIDAEDLRKHMPNVDERDRPASPQNLTDMERDTILATLKQTQGHQERAAAILGISRRTLHRKLKTYLRAEEA